MIYKSLYKWHKWIGLVICVPVILWALSGLLHPTLRLTKPVLATHKLIQQPFAVEAIVSEPAAIMARYGIKQVSNARVITMHGKHYYRVSLADGNISYFDMQSGSRLIDGELRYAEYLARYYLGDQHTAISSIVAVKQFSEEYAPINRFLPVWQVSFQRDDELRLYIDTESSRLAAAVDNLRAELLWWFGTLHNWSFLDKGSLTRISLFMVAMLAMFIIGLTGLLLYGLRYQCMKKISSEQTSTGVAYFHRTVGLLISLSTLMFSFSGGMHVWHKLSPDERHTHYIEDSFAVGDLVIGLKQALFASSQHGPVKAVSMVRISNEPYYRLVHATAQRDGVRHAGRGSAVSYVHGQSGALLADADSLYAQQLASRISGRHSHQISSVQAVTRFNAEYGFIDRRLPVVEVQFKAGDKPSYYVDLATGRLAAMVDDSRRFEQFTFRMFHKWRFADGLGKNGRDAIIALFTMLNVIVIILGVVLFISRRRRNTSR
ncbi:PepSY domain-containing protein [Sulfuriflexus mobilis]|uniref:PepSY domain-containing protein n=1 Tax=Sulfuriflexus mobilis TaxID=1811807 RepID=UPI000F8236C0|nr:PepSY domain-containing protein [Sulfuriflexus mobilis]